MIHISLNISKLGDKIPSLGLPAGITCRIDAPCKKGCYAKKGNYNYSTTKKSLQGNLDAYLSNPNGFFDEIKNFVDNGDIIYKYFRWFHSGDIVDFNFLEGIIKIAKTCKDTKFLVFTKKFSIVNMYLFGHNGELPSNLNIVFSGWDSSFEIENPFNLPTTYVCWNDAAKDSEIPENAFECKGSCKECKKCWQLEKGQSVYFHKH